MDLGSLPGTFRLDRSRNASAQVYDHLRELIVTLALAPGAALSRADLAAYFDLSPMPVRDALTQLHKERLVDVFPQYLTRVSGIDLDSARQAHVLRLSVELEMARSLARAPDPLLEARLLAIVETQRACLDRDDFDGFIAADAAFHRTMFEAARLMEIHDLIRNVSGHLDRLRRLHLPVQGKARSVLDDHAAIAHAIGRGDADAACAAARGHLSGTLAALDGLHARYPDFILPAPPARAA
jgi:DNA-binding GntR family transcriptional regulator